MVFEAWFPGRNSQNPERQSNGDLSLGGKAQIGSWSPTTKVKVKSVFVGKHSFIEQ